MLFRSNLLFIFCACVCPFIRSQELFCVCGALKRARLAKVGVAEVVFVRKEDAVSAYRKYNNRCLDGERRWQDGRPLPLAPEYHDWDPEC